MRLKKVRLVKFKRFDDLTIDLGDSPSKIVALVGPNGCGKSSIFDAFEQKLKDFHPATNEPNSFYSKSFYYEGDSYSEIWNKNQSIYLTGSQDPANFNNKSFYIRTSYRYTTKLELSQISASPEMTKEPRPGSSIAMDTRLQENYKRLIGKAFEEFDIVGTKSSNQVKEELLGKINEVLKNILDITISSLGNVMQQKGSLFFEKGNSKNFPHP